jgi:hypothetical protein
MAGSQLQRSLGRTVIVSTKEELAAKPISLHPRAVRGDH